MYFRASKIKQSPIKKTIFLSNLCYFTYKLIKIRRDICNFSIVALTTNTDCEKNISAKYCPDGIFFTFSLQYIS